MMQLEPVSDKNNCLVDVRRAQVKPNRASEPFRSPAVNTGPITKLFVSSCLFDEGTWENISYKKFSFK